MYIAVIRYDKSSKSVLTIFISDDLQQMKEGAVMNLDQLGQYTVANNAVPFNFSIDRNGKVTQDVGSFDRLMPIERARATSSSDLTCSNIVLNEIKSSKGKTLGYRVLNSDTCLVSNLKTDDLLALEKYHNRSILQNGIIRNGVINCYPHHPFAVMTVNIDKKPRQVSKKELKKTKPENNENIIRNKPNKPAPKTFSSNQNVELEKCKKNGIDPKLISNPNLSNHQMRVLWMSKKNGARAEAFNKPEYSTESMKFYADLIYTEEDEKKMKGMLNHPELSVAELNALYDCVLDDVKYDDLIGKTDQDIFIERQKILDARQVDNRKPEERDFEVFDKAIMAAMMLKGLV